MLGLDILKQHNFVIDLESLELYSSKEGITVFFRISSAALFLPSSFSLSFKVRYSTFGHEKRAWPTGIRELGVAILDRNDPRTDKRSFNRTRGELIRTRASLHRTRGELIRTGASLHRTRGELIRTRASLNRTRGELIRTGASLHRTRGELIRTGASFNRTGGVLIPTRARFNRTGEATPPGFSPTNKETGIPLCFSTRKVELGISRASPILFP